MAWTPIADDFDAFSAAVINEYIGALNERRQALGQATIGVYAEDDDVPNSAAIISAWQQWIETNLASFVVSHDAGVERAAGYYDNAATIDTYPDLAAVFSAAGLAPQVNWRRMRDHAFFAWGQAQEDDDYGGALAIFADLQAVLNALKWTYDGDPWHMTWIDGGELNAKLASRGGYATEAAAKAGVAALYALAAPYSTGEPPKAISTANDFPPPLWSAKLDRLYAYAQYIRGATIPCAREIDFHYRGVRPAMFFAEEFDPNGDFPAGYVEGRASYFSTIGPTVSATVVSDCFGDPSLPQPNWSPNPGPVGRGYDKAVVVNHTEVIERWTGFTYQ